MRINEIECDDNIVLSKFKFNCDEIDKSIPAPLPRNLNHFMLIVGKPGSSKRLWWYQTTDSPPADKRPTADAVPGRGRRCESKKTPQRPL